MLKKPVHVILDNGHGADTPGKRSPVWPDGSQLLEFEFNRSIVNRVFTRLQALGVRVTRLVPELNDISITDRINRINRIVFSMASQYQCVLVSVHGNAGGGTGFEVLTSVGQTKSDELAEIFYNVAPEFLKGFKMRKDTADGDSDKEDDHVSILPKSHCPAVLTENLFMDRVSDYQFMMSESGRDAIANMHVKALQLYIQKSS